MAAYTSNRFGRTFGAVRRVRPYRLGDPATFASLEYRRIADIEHSFDIFNITAPTDI